MLVPSFTDPQYIDANGTGGLNAAFGAVSGSLSNVGSGAWAAPGLIAPESMTVAFSGLVATVTLPAPWALVTSGGDMASAHGTVTNQDTQTYTVDFTPLVPGTGTVTAYLLASATTIMQNPVPIPGPPPGHPSYNPNFIPVVGYAQTTWSVALTGSVSAPDNATTFGLLSTTLTAGQSVIAVYSDAIQFRAPDRSAAPLLYVAGGTLTPQAAQFTISPETGGQTNTLPLAHTAIGLTFRYVNATGGNCTLVTSGPDVIVGLLGSPLTSVTVPSNGTIALFAKGDENVYFVLSASPGVIALGGSLAGTLLAPTIATSVELPGTPYSTDGFTSNNGTITAGGSGGLFRAANGALGSGDGNRVPILNDFTFTNGLNGWEQLPDGSIEQWGEVTTTNGVTVVFPIEFPTTILNIVMSESEASSATWGAGFITLHAAGGQTNSSFVHWSVSWNGTAYIAAANTCCWRAKGY